jgi:plasmid stability protein
MAVSVTIRDVPDETRDELAARAARLGQSLQEYLRGQLVELAAKPTPDLLWGARAGAGRDDRLAADG